MSFSRPPRFQRTGPRPAPPPPPTRAADIVGERQPTWASTIFGLIGLGLTAVFLGGGEPSHLARGAAIGVGASLGVGLLCDVQRGGFANLVRADLLALLSLYFLTLFEFFVPQREFDSLISRDLTARAISATLLGFAGLLLGRHLGGHGATWLKPHMARPVPRGWLLYIFWSSFLLGFLHMAMAVKFNLLDVVHWWMEPRFAQPWGRGKFGDWKALLNELSMLLFLLPPIAGIALARKSTFRAAQFWPLLLGFVVLLFYGFTSGTRNLFCTYVITFLIGYAFALGEGRKRALIVATVVCSATVLLSTVVMLEFRNIGLRTWLHHGPQSAPRAVHEMQVDRNLLAIGQLVEAFPARKPYLGWEVVYVALVRPIPRAIWKGKPEGLSYSIEDAAGAGGAAWTVAASFIGEGQMAGGPFAIVAIGLLFGALAGWWNRLASPENSEIGILAYASGFFAAVISMRSLFVFTTALLPTVISLVLLVFIGRGVVAQAERLRRFATARRAPPRQRR